MSDPRQLCFEKATVWNGAGAGRETAESDAEALKSPHVKGRVGD
jgi:hypothetical protein